MTNVIFKSEWLPLISTLPNESAGELIKAIAQHCMTGEEPSTLSPIMTGIYQMMITSIDENAAKYEERCNRSRASARARWEKERAEQEQETPETEQEQEEKPRKRRKVKTTAADPEVEQLVSVWNETLKPITGKGAVCTPGTQKERGIRALIQTHGLDTIITALRKIAEEKGWITEQSFLTFDWAMDPEHMDKLLQGNYDNRNAQKTLSTKKPEQQRRRPQIQLS